MKIAGLVLVVLGVLGLLYGGIRYTSRDTVLDVGPIHATADREHKLPIAPIAGALMLAAGAAMLVSSRRGL
jgi:hypothetical protein